MDEAANRHAMIAAVRARLVSILYSREQQEEEETINKRRTHLTAMGPIVKRKINRKHRVRRV